MDTLTIGAPVVYHGPTSNDGVVHGENCRILELLPHGTYFTANGACNPQPKQFDPTLSRYIGNWLSVESTDEPGLRFVAPASWFHTDKGGVR